MSVTPKAPKSISFHHVTSAVTAFTPVKRWKLIDENTRYEAARRAGEPVSAYLYVISYMGHGIASVRTACDMAIDNAWLHPAVTGQPAITPHVLRHTRATWTMFAGEGIWEAAGALGMSNAAEV
jgi:integrase